MPIEENKIQKHVDNFLASIANETPLDDEVHSSTEYWLAQIAAKLHAGDLTPSVDPPEEKHLYLHKYTIENYYNVTIQGQAYIINVTYETFAINQDSTPTYHQGFETRFIKAMNTNGGVNICGIKESNVRIAGDSMSVTRGYVFTEGGLLLYDPYNYPTQTNNSPTVQLFVYVDDSDHNIHTFYRFPNRSNLAVYGGAYHSDDVFQIL